MALLEKIRILAAEKGVSLAQFERDCGFSKNSVVKWDKNMPSGDKLLRAAQYFGVSVDYLLGNDGEEEEFPEIYFSFLRGAKELDLSQRDLDLLLDIARRFKKEDEAQ
ncbi:MAG: helix-turn-helix domain-containing protein [Oscillospiraceae bacterium]